MRILYVDCFAGISGDMAIAALVDAGADMAYIEQELDKIKIEPFTLEWKKVVKCGVTAQKFDVHLDPDFPPTAHRHYADIVELIEQAGFSESVQTMSLAIFRKIAIAEGRIHNIPLEHVHFHEVGAIDSIVDIIGTALAIESLKVDRIVSAPVPLGSGTVRCAHGIFPVPAPATLELMTGLPIASSRVAKEMTTPTGAGIIAVIADAFSESIPAMTLEAVGYGAGTRDLPDQPNVLRIVIGNQSSEPAIFKKRHTDPFHIASLEYEHDHEHPHQHNHMHDHEHAHGHEHSHDHNHLHHHEHSHDHSHPHLQKHLHVHASSLSS